MVKVLCQMGLVLTAFLAWPGPGFSTETELGSPSPLVIAELRVSAPESVQEDYIKSLVPELMVGSIIKEEDLEGLLKHLENRLRALGISYQVAIIPRINDNDDLIIEIDLGEGFFHSFGFKGRTLAAHYGYKNLFDDFITAEAFLGVYEQSLSLRDPRLGLSPLYLALSLSHQNLVKEFVGARVELGMMIHPDFSIGVAQSFALVDEGWYFETSLPIVLFEDSWIEHMGLRVRAHIEPKIVYKESEKAFKLNSFSQQKAYLTPDISIGLLESFAYQTRSNLPNHQARVLESAYLGDLYSEGQDLMFTGNFSLAFDNIIRAPVFVISNFSLGFEPLYQVKYEEFQDGTKLSQGLGALVNLSLEKPIGIRFKLGALIDLDTAKPSVHFYFTQEDL